MTKASNNTKKSAKDLRSRIGRNGLTDDYNFLVEMMNPSSKGEKSLFEELFSAANDQEFSEKTTIAAKEFDKKLDTTENKDFSETIKTFNEYKQIEKESKDLTNFHTILRTYLDNVDVIHNGKPSKIQERFFANPKAAAEQFLFSMDENGLKGPLSSFIKPYYAQYITNNPDESSKKYYMEELNQFKKDMIDYFADRANHKKSAQEIKNDIENLPALKPINKLQSKYNATKEKKATECIGNLLTTLEKAEDIKPNINKRLSRIFKKAYFKLKDFHQKNKVKLKSLSLKTNNKENSGETKTPQETIIENFKLAAEALDKNDEKSFKKFIKVANKAVKQEISGLKTKSEIDMAMLKLSNNLDEVKLDTTTDKSKVKAISKIVNKHVSKGNKISLQ